MIPNFLPGHLRNGGGLGTSFRPRACVFCGQVGMTVAPRYICASESCQERKRAKAKAAKQRYDAKRRKGGAA